MQQPSLDEQLEEALRLHREGQLDAAVKLYHEILKQDPDDVDTLHLLGAVTAQQGDARAGLDLIDRAIALDPACADFHNNRGLILAGLGRIDDAISAHRRAIELNGDFAEAHNNLGNALVRTGRLDEAAAEFHRTIALRPDYANAHSNLGVVLHRQDKFDEAIAAYRSALRVQPNHAEAQSNLGAALREVGDMDKAIEAFRAAIAIDETCLDAHANLGAALHDLGQFDEAIASLERAIQLNPQANFPHYNLALSLLQRGDYERGLAEYEHRAYAVASRQRFAMPPWDGRELGGKTILLHAEGGFGDVIQFARFVPMVKARGGRVILLVQPELIRLFSTLDGAALVLPKTNTPPPFDVQCPLLSLPRVFRTTIQNIPAKPYLSADPMAAAFWSARLGNDKRRRIGLLWAGSPKFRGKRKSIPIASLSPFGGLTDARFVSLQQDQPGAAPPGMELLDCSGDLHDFADAAGLIANLDLVISADSAAAHLAGAMGKKVYLLLPHVADWRWLRDRTDSPWYPTMRLFRQPSAGDWNSVIAQVVEALKSEVSAPE
jgi:tetratricopeptide (TPR) repeat protein